MSKSQKSYELRIPKFINDDDPACAQTDPELFFPQEGFDSAGRNISKYINLSAAKNICNSCPLKLPCLEYALRNVEIGIWGGTTEEQRKLMRKGTGKRAIYKSPAPEVW